MSDDNAHQYQQDSAISPTECTRHLTPVMPSTTTLPAPLSPFGSLHASTKAQQSIVVVSVDVPSLCPFGPPSRSQWSDVP